MKKRSRPFFFGFRAKVTVVAVLALLFVMGLSNYFIYRFTLDTQFEQMRQQLIVIAQTASLQVDADMLQRIPDGRESVESYEYKTVASRLRRIRDMNPTVKYIYTLKKTKTDGVWQFIVDLDPELERRGEKEITAYPGDPYDVTRFPEMVKAYEVASADRSLLKDEWGVTLSGYAPLRNRLGIVVAILGVDMDASDVYKAQSTVNYAVIWVLALGILLSIALAMVVSKQLTARIQKVIDGTRALSAGKLDHRIAIKGNDEITELSLSFNQMADSLLESRKKLEEYFFGIVQTLVRMLEQKDKYTQGHSERVGVYAQKLALKLGMTQEEADMMRKAGELHDIGKLAVHEHILMKAGPLTAEEWEMIRKHPVIGAEALKPVRFGEIIMTSIHRHHERFDGTGYPDKLHGDQISIYAHIMSVADAYDAMTTTRPYRKAVPRKEAIEEIRIHAGSQFHPKVAAAFIELLEEEKEVKRLAFAALIVLLAAGCSRKEEPPPPPAVSVPDPAVLARQKREEAKVFFDRAITAAANSRDSAKALEDLNRSIEADPTFARPYNERGFIYMKKGNLNRAIKDFTQSITFDPTNPDPYNNRAVCYYLKREFDKSWPDVKKVKELGGTPYDIFEKSLKKTSGTSQ